MKFAEETPQDRETVEALIDEKWIKAVYHWGVVGLGYVEMDDRDIFIDRSPDLEWRHIEGVKLSAIGDLPPKNDEEFTTLRIETSNSPELEEFMTQFEGELVKVEDGIYHIEVKQEAGPYILQIIQARNIGKVEVFND